MTTVPGVAATRQAGSVADARGRGYYSISEAAARLGVSRVTVWRWIRDGRLPVARLGHRTMRIAGTDLERLLALSEQDGSLPAPRVGWQDLPSAGGEHVVQFYESDAFLVKAVGEFVGAALRSGGVGVVVATPDHRASLEAHLEARGLDLRAVRESGQYVALDASGLLASFMVDGAPDPRRFRETVGELITRAAEGGRAVHAFGEMVALLTAEGNHAAAISLERLWNDLQADVPFSLFCAYPLQCLSGEARVEPLGKVCAQHGRVIPAESYSALSTRDERLREIAVLQHQAASLKAEIAERKSAEDRLRVALAAERAAHAATEAALAQRDEFLSIASHELKTPITSLRGNAQLALRRLARQGQLEPEQLAHTLHTITDQADRLARLVTQLLDVSRLEAGKLALEPQPTDLCAVVAGVVASARGLSEQHTISFTAPARLPALVDPLRLEQVFVNLLDNAIKYSPDGGSIEVVLAQSGATEVELSVRDHGLGIPPDQRAHIFDRYYQAHASVNRGGMGLGLYICQQIVDLHGGEVRAEFPEDGGSRFVVRLPLLGSGAEAIQGSWAVLDAPVIERSGLDGTLPNGTVAASYAQG